MGRWDGHEADLAHLKTDYERFAAFLRAAGVKEQSIANYRLGVADLARLGKRPEEVTAADLLELERQMRARLKPGTVLVRKNQAASFLQFVAFGEKTGREWPQNVKDAWKSGNLHKPRTDNGDELEPPKALVSLDDLKQMLKHVARIGPAQEIRNRALFAVLWDSGARAGEIVAVRGVSEGLKIRDIKLHQDYAELSLKGKTGRRQNVPIVFSLPYLKRWLAVHPDQKNPDAPLWVTEKGRNVEYKFLAQKFKDLVEVMRRDGYPLPPDLSPHAFRHGRAQYAKTVERMSDEMMRSFFGWEEGSKMPSRYGGMADASRAVLSHWTGAEEEKGQKAAKDLCPHCQAEITLGVNWCPECGAPISEMARGMADRAEEAKSTRRELADLKQALLLLLKKVTLQDDGVAMEGLDPAVDRKLKARMRGADRDTAEVLNRLFGAVEAPTVKTPVGVARLDRDFFEEPKTEAEAARVTNVRCFANGVEFQAEGKGSAAPQVNEMLKDLKENGVLIDNKKPRRGARSA